MRAAAVLLRIRPMQPFDIPQVLEIERQSFPTMWPQTVYQRELKNKLASYLVVYEPPDDDDGGSAPVPAAEPRGVRRFVRRFIGGSPATPTRDRIVGVVGIWRMVGEAHIVTIAVRQECRREGIGELLLTAALEEARATGQELVTLECRISSEPAQAMYRKYGFIRVGVRARYYSDNQEDAVMMTTPALSSPDYRSLLARLLAEQVARRGGEHPLAHLRWLPEADQG